MKTIYLKIIFLTLITCSCTSNTKLRYESVSGAKLRVIERGNQNKKPIILIHGGPGHPGYMWNLAELLPGEFTIEYFQRDLENSPSKGPFKVKNHVSDLHNLILSYKRKPILIGHSWGATLALEYAKKFKREVEKIIVISPGTVTSKMAKIFAENIYKSAGKDEKKARAMYKKLSTIKDKTEYKKLFDEYFNLIKNAYCYDCDNFAHEKMTKTPVPIINSEQNQVAKKETNKDYWVLVGKGKIRKGLNQIEDRVIHVQPEFDVNPAKDLIKVLKTNLKDYKLYQVKKAGHFPWLEPKSKDEVIKILKFELI